MKSGVMDMEFQEPHWLTDLKRIFLKCLDHDEGQLRFDKVLEECLLYIKNLFGAENVVYYQYNPIQQQLQLLCQIQDIKSYNSDVFIVIDDEMKQQLKGQALFVEDFFPLGLKKYDLYLPIVKKENFLGILAFTADKSYRIVHDDPFYKDFSEGFAEVLQSAYNISKIVTEEKRYKQLFRVTEKFHSSMNMDDVLGEIIYTLQQDYPSFSYYLLLTQDNDNHGQLPIKELEYDSANIAAMQSYVTGTSIFDDSTNETESVLYAPLKGKQGVYGVLQVISPNTYVFPRYEVEFITLLANTAGSAIENAQLYQQSKRLISDLQLINETSHRLNSNLCLSEMMDYMQTQINKYFTPEELGFIMYKTENEWDVLTGSSLYFKEMPNNPYIRFVKEKLSGDKSALFFGDVSLNETDGTAYKSIMAVPMIQSGEVKGFAVVMHRKPYHFSFEMFKLLQSLIHHSTLALTNSLLRQELERIVVTDHLTKLYSRSFLDEKMTESMERDTEGVFMLIDIDNFKGVNDTYGHQVGDDILVQVANVIAGSVRASDIPARWGGEELAIYLPKVNMETGVAIAERIRKKVEKETVPSVSISCGVACWKSLDADTFQALFKRADTALYKAKNSGKNKVMVSA